MHTLSFILFFILFSSFFPRSFSLPYCVFSSQTAKQKTFELLFLLNASPSRSVMEGQYTCADLVSVCRGVHLDIERDLALYGSQFPR